MAQLSIVKCIENEVYKITFTNVIEKLSQADKDLMRKYGEPTINTGGTYGTSPNVFTLPDNFIKIVSGFPFTACFDSKAAPFDTNTITKVTSYQTAFLSAFDDAFTTLRAETDTFSGEELHSV